MDSNNKIQVEITSSKPTDETSRLIGAILYSITSGKADTEIINSLINKYGEKAKIPINVWSTLNQTINEIDKPLVSPLSILRPGSLECNKNDQ